MLEQQQILLSHDFTEEGQDAAEKRVQIFAWTQESMRFTLFVLMATQLMILYTIIITIMQDDPYIPAGVLAPLQSAVFVYAWISWKRYMQSRGICYGIKVNVDAAEILDENHIDTENENGD